MPPVTRTDMRRIARSVLTLLDTLVITTPDDVRAHLPTYHAPSGDTRGFIRIERGRTETQAGLTVPVPMISYYRRLEQNGEDLPLNIRVHDTTTGDTIHIILKADHCYTGYAPVSTDAYGNIHQNKVIRRDMNALREELAHLIREPPEQVYN